MGDFSAEKKQGWERRERRKRDKPQPCKKLLKLYIKMLIKAIILKK
jgi:hypothetical protein